MCIVFAVGTGSEWGVVVVIWVLWAVAGVVYTYPLLSPPRKEKGRNRPCAPASPPNPGKRACPKKNRGKGKRSCDGLFTFLLTRSLHLPLHVKKVLRLGRERDESEEEGKFKCHLLFSSPARGRKRKSFCRWIRKVKGKGKFSLSVLRFVSADFSRAKRCKGD